MSFCMVVLAAAVCCPVCCACVLRCMLDCMLHARCCMSGGYMLHVRWLHAARLCWMQEFIRHEVEMRLYVIDGRVEFIL